jgi:hypothetical protein
VKPARAPLRLWGSSQRRRGYDVTPDAGVIRSGLTLKLLYRSGPGQVVVKLVEVAIPKIPSEVPENAVSETTLLTFDSQKTVPVSSPDKFQAREVTFLPTDPGNLDFLNNAYYVELSLIARQREPINSPLINPPAVATIQIFEQAHQ